jgi:dephospho-CoA kinase
MAKIIFGLVGPIACGKETVKKYLEIKYNAQSSRFSTILRDVLNRISVPLSRENVQKVSTVLRKCFGEDILAKTIAIDVEKFKNDVVVVDGVRRIEDIKYLRKFPNFKLLAINAEPEIRWQRLIKRNENVGDDKKTYKEFLKDHKYETELNIPKIMKRAKLKIDNNGDFKSLFLKIEEIMSDI